MGSLQEPPFSDQSATSARRFLIVDDDPLVRELFADVLSDLGDVDLAADGVEALAWLHRARYDLILSDVEMPRLDGCGFFEAAVAEQPEIAKAFVFVTASGDTPSRSRFFRRRRLPVLHKPVRVSELACYVQHRLDAAGAPVRQDP